MAAREAGNKVFIKRKNTKPVQESNPSPHPFAFYDAYFHMAQFFRNYSFDIAL
jgi:hypothetical protein